MTNLDFDLFQKKYIFPYKGISYIYIPEVGFIVWRFSTGLNAELLHIRVFNHGHNYGKSLVSFMLNEIEASPPYYTVFGFGLSSNQNAKKFYRSCGFNIADGLNFPYKKVDSFVFYAPFDELKAGLNLLPISGIDYRKYLVNS